jgi:dTDP-4-amino-4,6-dideoxygalactose transaminase
MTKKKIRIYDLKFDSQYRKKYQIGVKKILDNGFLSNHKFVRKLESRFSNFTKSKFALGTTSGTAALELIFRAINLKNKKVLIGNNTFIATAAAVKSAGGIPIPVDIDKNYYSLCPIKLVSAIKRYRNVGAVVIIHIAGIVTPNISKIAKICKIYKLPLIEDCAQAFGSKYLKKHVGNFGIAGAFSLHTTKVLTAGEGGLVVTNNKKFYEKMLRIRFFGHSLKNKLIHDLNGTNMKMSEFVALSALCDLDRVKKRIKKRQLLAKRYQTNLKDTYWQTLTPPKNTTTAFYKQVIISKFKRDKIIFELEKKIPVTGGVYYYPLNRQKTLQKMSDKKFINSTYFADYHFCPPCYPELSVSDVDYICSVLKNLNLKNL